MAEASIHMIPAEAVNAATCALREAFDMGVDGFEEQARLALEAAAPYMHAEAWDAGHAAGKSDAFAADKGFTGYHANPYRIPR